MKPSWASRGVAGRVSGSGEGGASSRILYQKIGFDILGRGKLCWWFSKGGCESLRAGELMDVCDVTVPTCLVEAAAVSSLAKSVGGTLLRLFADVDFVCVSFHHYWTRTQRYTTSRKYIFLMSTTQDKAMRARPAMIWWSFPHDYLHRNRILDPRRRT
jgi:hypothetical protein